MEEINELKTSYPELTFEAENSGIYVSGLKNNPDLGLFLQNNEDINLFKQLPISDLVMMKNAFGIYYDNNVEVILDLTDKKRRAYAMARFLSEPLEITINYKGQILSITILKVEESTISNLYSLMRSNRRVPPIVLSIANYEITTEENFEEEINEILNCVLFDVNYNFKVLFEPAKVEEIRRVPIRITALKKEPLFLTFKKYKPELIEYYRIAQQVEYLPFKYLCYFHIIEYFMDKSSFLVASKKIKNMIQKPDFHLKMDHYISETVKLLRKESEKHQTDLYKIERVFHHFIEKDEIYEYFDANDFLSLFTQEGLFLCGEKELKLPALDFQHNQDNFIKVLAKRIFSLRCSIVHSNPDFDEKKAIPFIANRTNIEKLRTELFLIEEIAKIIILKTAE